jgi:hypothetical protein
MKLYSTFRWLILALIQSAALFSQAPQLRLYLEPNTCRPGDLVTLHAEMQSSEYAELSLSIPQHPALHWVAQSEQPLSYNAGSYQQHLTWVLQPLHPATIELIGIVAQVKMGKLSLDLSVQAPLLTVELDPAVTDSMLPLSEEQLVLPPEHKSLTTWPLLIAVVSLASAALFWQRKRQNRTKDRSTRPPARMPLNELAQALHFDHIPYDQIEALLAQPNLQLSTSTRAALESVAYGPPRADTLAALRLLLSKEIQR